MSKPEKLTMKKMESFVGKTSKGSEFVLMVEPVVGLTPCEQLLAIITALQGVYASECEIL
jgi:hypothetical protein